MDDPLRIPANRAGSEAGREGSARADGRLPARPIAASLRPNISGIQDLYRANRGIDPVEMYLFRYPLPR